MDEKTRIVFLGKTGAGKSSLANIIFGEKDVFKESGSANSETKKCEAKDARINGRNICLIDTPGLFDTDLNSTELTSEILRCIKECAPGPHAFLIVLKVERYTKQEQDIVDIILQYFSTKALKHTTVVFTHGNQLEKKRIKEWVNENKALRKLVDKCGGRCHVFDNKHWNNSQDQYRNNQVQVKELRETIDKTVRENGGRYYINKLLKEVTSDLKRWFSILANVPVKVPLGALTGAEEMVAPFFASNPSTQSSEEEEGASASQYVQEVDPMRIALLGKTGSGKSSLANTIFGEKGIFEVLDCKSGTRPCQTVTRTVNGRSIQLVVTPGLFDTDLNSPEILRYVEECGPHAFLLVLKVEKYTMIQQGFVDEIIKCFSEDALKYTTVVFTHGGELPKGMRIEEWVRENEALRKLVGKCGGRCHVFDNKYWNNSQDQYRNNQVQVKELLETINNTVTENEGGYYSNERLQKNKMRRSIEKLADFKNTSDAEPDSSCRIQ